MHKFFTYHITLDSSCKADHLQKLREGITLEDGPVLIDDVRYDGISKKKIFITLHSGKNRIVRRMFEHFGYKIAKLDRTDYAGLTKQGLRCGTWRHLTAVEIKTLKG